MSERYLVCRVDRTVFAVAALAVRDIAPLGVVRRPANTPGWARGIGVIRGELHPLVDLRGRWGLPPREAVSAGFQAPEVTVLLEDGPRRVAVVVDEATSIVELAFGEETLRVGGDPLLPAVAQHGGELVFRMDPGQLPG